jgi:hypothetical protein
MEKKFTQFKEAGTELEPPSFKVIYENDKINLPFKLEDLVYFADKEGNKELKTHPQHHRAAWLPKTGVGDKNGNIFFDTTIKGVGYLYPEKYVSKKDKYYGRAGQDITLHKSKEYWWGYNMLGLVDKRILNNLIKSAEELSEAGMRCEAIASAAELEKVILGGETVGVEKLREYLKTQARGMGFPRETIDDIENFTPVQIVRLVRENFRIKDFCKASEQERKKMLKDVFQTLNLENELTKKEKRYDANNPESVKQYLFDYFAQAAKNLAILHNKGKVLYFLNSGNITLSLAEVVDLDSLMTINEETKEYSVMAENDPERGVPGGYVKDTRDEIYALSIMFLKAFRGLANFMRDDRVKLQKHYLDSYLSSLDNEELKRRKVDSEKLRALVQEFSQKMIAEAQIVSPIKYF